MKIKEKIKNWYRGKYSPATLEKLFNPEKPIPSEGHYEPPLFARTINGIGKFWDKHWQWIIGTVIALIGLYLLYLQLIKSK
jgi:hypothetical protein